MLSNCTDTLREVYKRFEVCLLYNAKERVAEEPYWKCLIFFSTVRRKNGKYSIIKKRASNQPCIDFCFTQLVPVEMGAQLMKC